MSGRSFHDLVTEMRGLSGLPLRENGKDEKPGGKKPSEEDMIAFFQKNPNPNDDVFHKNAEKQGWNVHEAEAVAYKLATDAVRFWTKGRSTTEKYDEKKADPEELKKGIEVEKEHTDNTAMARRIALDHLSEIPDYYSRLAKMEAEGKKAKKS